MGLGLGLGFRLGLGLVLGLGLGPDLAVEFAEHLGGAPRLAAGVQQGAHHLGAGLGVGIGLGLGLGLSRAPTTWVQG